MPSHYLNQCWIIVNWTLRNKLLWNSYQNTKLFIHKNVFENIVCEMASVLSRGDELNKQCQRDVRRLASHRYLCYWRVCLFIVMAGFHFKSPPYHYVPGWLESRVTGVQSAIYISSHRPMSQFWFKRWLGTKQATFFFIWTNDGAIHWWITRPKDTG